MSSFSYLLTRLIKKLSLSTEPFYTFVAVDTKSTTRMSGAFRIPFDAVGNPPDGVFHRKQKGTHRVSSLSYTSKRFRTAVAGMKIPSPGPLDDGGV